MKGQVHATGDESWQAELTPHKLSHTSLWAYLTQGLTLLGNLCGLAAIIKEVAAALSQARKAVKSLSPWQQRWHDLASCNCLAPCHVAAA